VAQAVYELRGKRSAQWLANRTKELGHEVSRSVIADLETGRRRYVTTAELVMFARALRTSPVALVYPFGPGDGDTVRELTPSVYEQQIDAVQWFSGLLDTHEANIFWNVGEANEHIEYGRAVFWDAEDAAEYNRNLKRLRTWREFWELDRRRSALLERLVKAREGTITLSDAERTELIDAVADLERRANELAVSDGW
jgi:hypothetical protein